MILLHNFIFLNNKAGRYVRFRADQNSCHLKQNKQNKQNNQIAKMVLCFMPIHVRRGGV